MHLGALEKYKMCRLKMELCRCQHNNLGKSFNAVDYDL